MTRPSRRIVVVWAGRALVLATILSAILFALETSLQRLHTVHVLAAFATIACSGLVFAPLYYRSWTYEVASDGIEVNRGVVRHRRVFVPGGSVQHVDVNRTALDRLLGLSRVVVHTAGVRSRLSIPGLRPDDAADVHGQIAAFTREDR